MLKLKRNATIVLMLWLLLVLFEPLIKTINKVSAIRLQSTVHHHIETGSFTMTSIYGIWAKTNRYRIGHNHLRQRWNEWNFLFFFLSLLISCQLVLCVFAFCLVGFDLVCYFNGIFNMILDQNVWPFFIIYASISIQITSCLLHFNSLLNNKNSHFFLLNCHFKFLFLLQFHSLCLYRI